MKREVTDPILGAEWEQVGRGAGLRLKLGTCEVCVSRWSLYRGSTGQWHVAVFAPGERASRRWWRKTVAEAMALGERELCRAVRQVNKRAVALV